MATLLVDFRFHDSKDSRIVCLHIQYRHVNIPDGQMQFYVLSTLFINACSISNHFHMVVLHDGWPSHIHSCPRFALLLSWELFLSKKCKVSFLFSIYMHNKGNK